MMGVSVNTYEDPNGDKTCNKSGVKASNLNDLTHQVFEAGNHHVHCASDTKVHIFKQLIEFLNKNKNNISPDNKIRIFCALLCLSKLQNDDV